MTRCVPPVPSEGVVVALAAVAVAGDGPHLALLALAAAAGAFLGDTLTFVVGRRFGPQRLARVTRPGVRRLLERASGTLDRRGALVVLTARYVPLGRVAVNLTAGATGFAPRRFVGLAALAAATWAVWSVGIGALAGHWLHGNPLLGSAARRRAGPRPRARRRPGRPPADRLGSDAGALGIRRRRARGRGRRPDGLTAPPAPPPRPLREVPTGRPAVCTLHPRVPIMALALSW